MSKKNKLTDKQKYAMICRKMAEKKNATSKRIEAPFPHFRHYRKSGHPALIVGEQSINNIDEYRYRKVTHSARDGRHLNEKIFPNPNPKDSSPMYIGKSIRHDDKNNFNNTPLPWKYPKK